MGEAVDVGQHRDVIILGAGIGGIAIAHELHALGIEHQILERGLQVGGTWRDNVYPGCACDIPSDLYSFSWAPNPEWSRRYAPQAEIQGYLQEVAAAEGLQVQFGVDVGSADWDDQVGLWTVRTNHGAFTCRVLLVAAGALSEPRSPDVPGLATFPGPVVHTARWRPIDVAGRRVAVVGTGASAIQVIPELAQRAAAVEVFQRTPAWVLPRHDRPIGRWRRDLFARLPVAQRISRAGLYWSRELTVHAMVHDSPLLRVAARSALRRMARQVPDPGRRATLTPTYSVGCKRALLSDDYYPAMAAPHVHLHGALQRVAGSMLFADQNGMEVDDIVLATGFEVLPPPLSRHIRAGGLSVADDWEARGGAYLGVFTAGAPNLAWLTGPNSGLGGNSMTVMIEAQARVMAAAAGQMLASDEPLTVRAELQSQYCSALERKMSTTVWQNGGCSSWYRTPDGRVQAIWPDQSWRFVRLAAQFDLGALGPVRVAA